MIEVVAPNVNVACTLILHTGTDQAEKQTLQKTPLPAEDHPDQTESGKQFSLSRNNTNGLLRSDMGPHRWDMTGGRFLTSGECVFRTDDDKFYYKKGLTAGKISVIITSKTIT